MSKVHQICYPSPWLGPPLTAIQYVTYFRFFVGDVIFKIMMREWARVKDDDAHVLSSSLGGGTECEVCRYGLHLVLVLVHYRNAAFSWTMVPRDRGSRSNRPR